jgi:hypothetical protein
MKNLAKPAFSRHIALSKKCSKKSKKTVDAPCAYAKL